MPEPGSTAVEADATTSESLSPQLGGIGLTEELTRRVFRKLPRGGENPFILLQKLGLDKVGSSPESTVAVAAVIRLARYRIAGLVNADDKIPPESKPTIVRTKLERLLQIQSDETPQQRFAEVLEFVLGDEE
jgi:hypothetical protein